LITIAKGPIDRPPARHLYGSPIGSVIDVFNDVDIVFESDLERSWAQVLVADPKVAMVHAQQELKIRMDDETVRKHTFDLLVFWKSGLVAANACRYSDDIDDLDIVLRRAADTVGDAFADEYRLLTEEGLSDRRVRNAQRVIDCGRDADLPAQDAIRNALPRFGQVVRLAELDAIVGDGRRGSRAAIAMIKHGVFAVLPGQIIDEAVALRNLFTN